jgi:hypothetical protein
VLFNGHDRKTISITAAAGPVLSRPLTPLRLSVSCKFHDASDQLVAILIIIQPINEARTADQSDEQPRWRTPMTSTPKSLRRVSITALPVSNEVSCARCREVHALTFPLG